MKLGVYTVLLADLSFEEALKYLTDRGSILSKLAAGDIPARLMPTRMSFWPMIRLCGTSKPCLKNIR